MALSSGYVPGLDGLRAISIGLVLAGHFFGLPGGAIGVDIFFVISGYLITTILLREVAQKGNFSLKSFYIRRVLRIFPAFAFMLLALLIVTPFFVRPERQLLQYLSLLYAASYAMNWTRIFGLDSGVLGHTWSLAIEEQFYALWPLILIVILAVRRRLQLLILAGLIVATTLWRAYLAIDPGMGDRVFFGSDTRANEILIGCFFAFLPMHRLSGQLAPAWLIPTAFLGILAMVGSPDWLRVVDTLLIAISAAWLIAAVHDPRRTLFTRFLESDLCTAVGRLSYSLYLWHFPIMLTLGPRGLISPESLPVANLGLSFVAATFSYHLIETPFLRMKDRLRPAKSPSLSAPSERAYPARI